MKSPGLHRRQRAAAFTLLEMLLAAAASAIILIAVYGVFSGAIRLRDSATRRVHDSRLRLRAEKILRDDLRGTLISGGILASVFAGDSGSADPSLPNTATPSSIPGYLRFTTTTGRNDASGLYGDVQLVEYYLAQDPAAGNNPNAGAVLTRYVTRDILDSSSLGSGGASTGSSPSPSGSPGANGSLAQTTPTMQTPILSGVQTFQVSFYDGSNWQTSWNFSGLGDTSGSGTSASASPSPSPSASNSSATSTSLGGQTSLPDAVKIDIQQVPATPDSPTPPPLEILVPWSIQPFAAPTPVTSGDAEGDQPQ